MMTGGLFNAFAFAGAGFLFKSLDGNGYGEEMKRHNLAMEKLARDREIWNENEINRRNKVQELRQKLSDANKNINEKNAALDALRRSFPKEPVLHDYYQPSAKMQGYVNVVEGVTMG